MNSVWQTAPAAGTPRFVVRGVSGKAAPMAAAAVITPCTLQPPHIRVVSDRGTRDVARRRRHVVGGPNAGTLKEPVSPCHANDGLQRCRLRHWAGATATKAETGVWLSSTAATSASASRACILPKPSRKSKHERTSTRFSPRTRGPARQDCLAHKHFFRGCRETRAALPVLCKRSAPGPWLQRCYLHAQHAGPDTKVAVRTALTVLHRVNCAQDTVLEQFRPACLP